MTLLAITDLAVELIPQRRRLVDGVSLTVARGETVGLVGESGSGKSLTAFAVMGLFPSPSLAIAGGDIALDGTDLRALPEPAMRSIRGGRIGMVFQDPAAFLDPLMRVGDQIAEPLRAHGGTTPVADLLGMVELPPETAGRYPHQLSGGQRQRVVIAAALATRPSLLLADEPTTALDATVQAGILDLLARLQAELGLAILLISHDLPMVAARCHRVAVMYAGRVIESGPAARIFTAPRHPYTQGLARSTLATDAAADALFSIPGRVPPADAMPTGCRFHPRCPIALDDPCRRRVPPLDEIAPMHSNACWRSAEGLRAWDHD